MTGTYARVLNVEEAPRMREKISSYLEDAGFVVYEASNEDDAMKILREEKPDIVLSALDLPNGNGLTLLNKVKSEAPATPFIIIGTEGKMKQVVDGLKQGAVDFLMKPLSNLSLLEQAVCRGLERGRLILENQKYKKDLEYNNRQLAQSLLQLKEDQDLGRSVQLKLLPMSGSKLGRCDIRYHMIPSLYLSGDFVDYFAMSENKFLFYVADVSGHGASSAFVTVLLKMIVRKHQDQYLAKRDDTILFPEKICQKINEELFNAKLGKYITLVIGIIDEKNQTVSYCIAGHHPNPILVSNKKTTYLAGSGFPLGIRLDATYESHTVKLTDTFNLYVYSDGIFEIMAKNALSEKEKILLNHTEKTGNDFEKLLTNLGFTENQVPDDITVLSIQRGVS